MSSSAASSPSGSGLPAAERHHVRRARHLAFSILLFVGAAFYGWRITLRGVGPFGGSWRDHFTTFKWICEILAFSLIYLITTKTDAARSAGRRGPAKLRLWFAALLAAIGGLIYFEYHHNTRIDDPWFLVLAVLGCTAAGIWFLINWIRGTPVRTGS